MSKSLYLPLSIGLEEAELGGMTTSIQPLSGRNSNEFVNSSLSTIQTFFSRMIQLDPEEDELFGETGRDVNGFRLTTEDEPAGVDHDTAISIRSDHISNISIQSGKSGSADAGTATGGSSTTLVDSGKSWTADEWIGATLKIVDNTDGALYFVTVTDNDTTSFTFVTPGITVASSDTYRVEKNSSDSLLNMGSWNAVDGTWGVNGALRIDMSRGSAFSMESNFGDISFDNNTTTRRLTANVYNLKVGTGTQHAEFQDLDSGNPSLFFYDGSDPSAPSNGAVVYAKSGDLYRRKSDGTISAWATGGGSGTIDEAADYSMTGTWSFSPSSGKSVPSFQPYASGAPFTIGSNGFDQVVSRLNADLLDGNHASVFPQDAAGVGTTIAGNWTFTPTSGGDFPLMPSNTKFNQSTGTAPFQVDSTTVVANLESATTVLAANSTLFNSQADTVFAKLADNETISGDYTFSGDSTFSGEVDFSITTANKITVKSGALKIGAKAAAEAPFSLTAPYSLTVVTGLNADYVDGYHSTSFGRLGSADEVTANWEFSGQPDFTNGTVPFSVTSTAVVNNLRSATSAQATNSLQLGGVAAASYTRNDNNETITSIWQFGNAANAVPIKMAEMSTPTEPATSFGYLYHNSADNGIYWMTHNTEGDHDTNLLAGESSAVFADAATTSQTTYQEFRTIAPTTPDQTYAIEVSLVGRGTAGSFNDGFVYVRAYATFYTNDSAAFVRLPDATYFRTPFTAKDGSGSTKTVTSNNTGDFDLQIIDSSDNIVVKARGHNSTSGTPNAFSWKCWTKVYQV